MSRHDYTLTKIARADVAAHVAELLRLHVISGDFADFAAECGDEFMERRRHAAMDRLRTQLKKTAANKPEVADG